jgi:hypothetical protein
MFGKILLLVLFLILLWTLPNWDHNRKEGYFSRGSLGLIVLAVIVLAFFSNT